MLRSRQVALGLIAKCRDLPLRIGAPLGVFFLGNVAIFTGFIVHHHNPCVHLESLHVTSGSRAILGTFGGNLGGLFRRLFAFG